MTMLPTLVRLKFRHWPALWLPLFLLWPFAILLFVFSYVLFCALELSADRSLSRVNDCMASLWRLMCSARGLRVDIEAPDVQMNVSIH
jgi:hypothetical protein